MAIWMHTMCPCVHLEASPRWPFGSTQLGQTMRVHLEATLRRPFGGTPLCPFGSTPEEAIWKQPVDDGCPFGSTPEVAIWKHSLWIRL